MEPCCHLTFTQFPSESLRHEGCSFFIMEITEKKHKSADLTQVNGRGVYELSGSIGPFRISREPVAWPWRNLAASHRRPNCSSVNSHSPVGLVSRQWDAVDWACVLFDRHIHNDRASRSASSWHCACPFYSYRAGFFFWQSIISPRSVSPPTS